MLRAPKKQALSLVQPTHVDLFVENYDLLKQWAMRFTERDHELAEDLLHDTFIQFTISKPDLDTIKNLEGYLFIVMRNLHLSQLRRATRTPLRALSVVEFDTVDVSFWASDPRDRMRMRDELGAVCQYACIRKETAKVGSVLILRFFHGYYPEEIAQVMLTNRSAVEKRLQKARAEAKLYLEGSDRLAFINQANANTNKPTITAMGEDLRLGLRRQIFDSCQGECLTLEILRNLFSREQAENKLDQRIAAHIVSCQPCLDSVNSLLDLPPLASRYPVDTIGKDPGKKGGSGGGSGMGGGSGDPNMLDSYVKRRDEHFHHQPQELCISVNGQLQGFQKVVSGKGEFTLMLDTSESLGFVEVFSEQGLRLLMLNVEPPPSGYGKQGVRVTLSSGRTVDANLNFSGTHPALEVRYLDPELSAAAEAIQTTAAPNLSEPGEIATGFYESSVRGGSFLSKLFGWFKRWLQPARLTAAFAALLIVSLIWFKLSPTTVTASELLNKSVAAEASQLSNKERALHRTLDLEEIKDGQVTSRKRIEVWQSAEKGITARRLYDEQGRLAMGDWRNDKGIQTIYSRGQSPKLQPLPEKRTIGFDDAWQLSLSAGEFKATFGVGDNTQLEEREREYVISSVTTAEVGVSRATIVFSKEDLHAVKQTFTLKAGTETRDYRMTEIAYEWRPVDSVAPAVFEPNVELIGEAVLTSYNVRGGVAYVSSEGVVEASDTTTNNAASAPAAIATAALEVEVIEALDNAGAFTGEQIDVSPSANGKIVVTALVETAGRKRELLDALTNVRNNEAVRISIETVAEAEARIKRQAKGGTPNTSSGEIQQVVVAEGQNPVLIELKKRFSDEGARRFADRVLSRSRTLRSSALAMRQLSGRFSAADLQTLDALQRARWLALIRGHAERFVNEGEALRRDLQQFFPEAGSGGGGRGAVSGDAEIQARARELYDATITLDRGFGRSFALTAGGNANAPVTGSAFWHQFVRAVETARSLSNAK